MSQLALVAVVFLNSAAQNASGLALGCGGDCCGAGRSCSMHSPTCCAASAAAALGCARVDPDLCTTVAQAAAAGCPAVINPGEWHKGSPRSLRGEIWGGSTQGPSEDWGPRGKGVEKALWAIWRFSGCLQCSVSVLCFPFGLNDST